MSDLDSVAAFLVEEQEELRGRLSEIEGAKQTSPSYDEGFADSAQVSAEQGENRALSASLAEQLSEVNEALQRIEEGTYGNCVTCGEEIGEARLEAMPATPYCITHA